MCWSGATGRCTTKGAPQNNKTSIKFTARGQKAPGGVFMVGYSGCGLLQRHKLHGYRRGVPFVRTRRRGLRSMSGHPAYAWGNPPTLHRSSFPQRASRPAGGPVPKHAWGCAPRPPNTQAAAGYERCKASSVLRTDTLQGSRGRICPHPVPLPRGGGGAVWANSCLFNS